MGVDGMRVGLVSFAALAAAAPTSVAPIDFKGIQLGITLDQFRALPHPDGRAATPDCTGDLNEGRNSRYGRPSDNPDVLVSDATEQSLDVRYCVFRSTQPLYRGGPTGTLGLTVGNSGTIRYVFKFVPDETGTPRLFEIDVIAPPDALANIRQPLSERFGQPVVTASTVQNLLGATFERQTLVWQREGTSLTIQSPSDRVHQMRLSYVHDALSARVTATRAREDTARLNRI